MPPFYHVVLLLSLLSVSAAAAGQFSSCGLPDNERTSAKNDIAIKRLLQGGQSHSYILSLSVGQFLQVMVDQKGIDVTLALYGPEGQEIAEIDGENGAWGPERLVFMANARGGYELRVCSGHLTAAPGYYVLQAATPHLGTAVDSVLLVAQTAFAECKQFQGNPELELKRKATVQAERVLEMYKTLEDGLGIANTALYLGALHYSFGEYDNALGFYLDALRTSFMLGGWRLKAVTLHNIGSLYLLLGEPDRALSYLSYALEVYNIHHSDKDIASTLNNLAAAHEKLGQLQKALITLKQALPFRRRLHDVGGEAYTLHNIGVLHNRLDDNAKAVQLFAEALSLRRKVGNRAGEAQTLYSMGLAYSALGQHQIALTHLDDALHLWRSLADQRGQAHTLYGKARVHSDSGKLDDARPPCQH